LGLRPALPVCCSFLVDCLCELFPPGCNLFCHFLLGKSAGITFSLVHCYQNTSSLCGVMQVCPQQSHPLLATPHAHSSNGSPFLYQIVLKLEQLLLNLSPSVVFQDPLISLSLGWGLQLRRVVLLPQAYCRPASEVEFVGLDVPTGACASNSLETDAVVHRWVMRTVTPLMLYRSLLWFPN